MCVCGDLYCSVRLYYYILYIIWSWCDSELEGRPYWTIESGLLMMLIVMSLSIKLQRDGLTVSWLWHVARHCRPPSTALSKTCWTAERIFVVTSLLYCDVYCDDESKKMEAEGRNVPQSQLCRISTSPTSYVTYLSIVKCKQSKDVPSVLVSQSKFLFVPCNLETHSR